MRFLLFTLLASQQVLAHCGLGKFYVNGASQGDGVGVRMNKDLSTWNSPVNDLTSTDMACGFSGTQGVPQVVPVPDGAALTFEFRRSPTIGGTNFMDASHQGPCSVYMKKVDSAIQDSAAGDGWFKIWDEGYDETAKQFCTTKLLANGGFVTVNVPKGLVGGSYLMRGELLALHNIPSQNNPQYYIGCSQIYLQSNGTMVPQNTVSIPGAVKLGDPADSYNMYDTPLKLPYPLPGPSVAMLVAGGKANTASQTEGMSAAAGANPTSMAIPSPVGPTVGGGTGTGAAVAASTMAASAATLAEGSSTPTAAASAAAASGYGASAGYGAASGGYGTTMASVVAATSAAAAPANVVIVTVTDTTTIMEPAPTGQPARLRRREYADMYDIWG